MLEVRDLTIGFRLDEGDFTAVESISFSLGEDETLAIVGESGSGKSVTALALTRLLPEPPALYKSGDILLDGHSIEAELPRFFAGRLTLSRHHDQQREEFGRSRDFGRNRASPLGCIAWQ